MFYINISETSVEFIQTSKNIIGQESIMNCGRKIITENLIKSGLIADIKSLKTAFSEIRLEASGDSKDNCACVVINDEAAYMCRFKISDGADNQLQLEILDEAKNFLKADPSSFENCGDKRR